MPKDKDPYSTGLILETPTMRYSSSISPVIIIGMHRSGTSMIARMLEQLGLFVGKKKDINHEATFFLQLNDWLLHQSGGSWDHPTPVKYLLANEKLRFLADDYLRLSLRSPRVASYLGIGNYLKYRSPMNLDMLWGWKDPRNTYTLPIWQRIFPNARVIHIYRNGIDVANSLKVRQERGFAKNQESYQRRRPLYWAMKQRGGLTPTARCSSLEGSFSLWEEYLQEAKHHVTRLGNKAIEICYELFLEEPKAYIATLAQFCGLETTDNQLREIAALVKKSRAYAYQNKPELLEFSQKVTNRLKMYGYG